MAKIKSILQIYVLPSVCMALSCSQASGPEGTMIRFWIFGQVAFSAPPQAKESPYAYGNLPVWNDRLASLLMAGANTAEDAFRSEHDSALTGDDLAVVTTRPPS